MRASTPALIAALFFSAAAAVAQPTRTLQNLVETAMTQGETGKIGKRTSRSFNLKLENPTKLLWFDQGKADANEHVFEVILKADGRPQAALLRVSKMVENGATRWLEGKDFLISLDGKVKSAIEFSGVVGKLAEKKLPSSAAKKAFEAEKRFWLEDSVNLDFSK